MSKYDPKKIEQKWQKSWLSKKTFNAKENSKIPKKTILVEFPYPSGSGLHMGHMRPFVAGDVVSKYFHLKGYNVMYPMGWDAFGLPAENFAIKNKVHPAVSTKQNVANAKKQILSWGTGFDWSREINTTDPEYYKWTQKIFLEFFKAGLAYEKFGEINWCPKDKTGLANEEVIDGKCERCGETVEKKNLRQWYLKITDYAESLLEGLKDLPEWPEMIKTQQENWIGRSEGAEIRFKVKGERLKQEIEIKVFTTRVDTLFGVTYLVLAPEHPLIQEITNDQLRIKNKEEIQKYINKCKGKTEEDRTNDKKEKTGVQIEGLTALNPVNNEEVPVWIADYVLGNYGTGAVMAVPAHDERDFDFATKYDLPIKEVVSPDVVLTGADAPKEGFETIERRVVDAIIENDKGEFLLIKENANNIVHYHFVGGGTEDEDDLDALAREIREESGYDDFYVIKKICEDSYCFGFRHTKNKNQKTVGPVFHVKLNSDQRVKSEVEEGRHEMVWVEKEKVKDTITWEGHLYFWNKFLNPNQSYTKDGKLINSGQFSGLSSEEARKKITEFVVGKQVSNYKLRDWVFSRQRYWGEPIPLIHCERCGIVPVPEKDLPVKLPNVKNYEPTGTGESPLANIDSWVKTPCPKCIEDSKKTKYLVFDFDGVIGDTYEVALKTYVALGIAKDKEDAKKVVLKYFTRHPEHHKRNNEFAKGEKERILKEQWQPFGREQAKYGIPLFKDFIKELSKIKNIKIAVVSAGTAVYVVPAVKASKLKTDLVLCAEDSFSKIEKIENIAKKWKTDIKKLYYFTDSQSDVFELEKDLDRKKIIGCSWGYLGFDLLREVLSENQILKTPKEIHNLFKPLIGKRETNTMPQWAGSSWYWLRYMDPKNKSEFSSIKAQKYWSPVDLYFGGMEHTTLHLLYSRFWNQFLFDRGLVTVKEPYKKRVPHGIILSPDGEKMSKSRGNVVNPDELVKLYGADTVRLYMMFLGPHGAQVAWNDKGIIGARRFIEKVFSLSDFISKEESKTVTIAINKTIKKVSADIEDFAFNTAVSSLMICVNTIFEEKQITKDSYKKLLVILSSFIPHATEELWAKLSSKKSIFEESFPQFDEKLIAEEKINIAVQINGKTRAILSVSKDISDEDLTSEALRDSKIEALIKGLKIQKTIVIKGKIVSFVVSN